MDKSTTLYAVTAAGAIYSAQTLLAPSSYLKSSAYADNEDTRAMCRAVGGGILGLTSISYLAAKSDSMELKLCAAPRSRASP